MPRSRISATSGSPSRRGLLAAALGLVVVSPARAQDALPRPTPVEGARPGYTLVWQDEFDRDGLPDPTRWRYDVGGHGWGNRERQFYTANRVENARVENGHLILEARREPWKGSAYTSARLVTRGVASWTYGRIEVRARLPRGRGSWPAIWMLPTTPVPMKWPDDGEIDIMEHVGHAPGVIHASLHSAAQNHLRGTQRTATTSVPDAADAFHVHAVEWEPDRIRAFVDGRAYFDAPRAPDADRETWPFDAPFHLLLNIAVGGNWGGQQGIDDESLPYRMLVDYVRVYQRR